MLDVRFSSALKAMLLLGHAEEEGSPILSSTQLARSLDMNPSLVRKLMVPLVQDGLAVSVRGRTGGVRLGRPAHQIALREVYSSAIGDKPLWAPGRTGPGSAWSRTTATSTSQGSPTKLRQPSSAHWQAAPSPTASTNCAQSTGPTALPLPSSRFPRLVTDPKIEVSRLREGRRMTDRRRPAVF